MQALPDTTDQLFISFQAALAGRYSIDRELGRGGMGIVYLAREVHLDRLVAIKLLPPELSARTSLRERFLREAQTAARLSHPHIIPIYAVEQVGEYVYYVMAYVDGETLAQRVQARGPVSASEASRLFREVAWALGYAHSQGLVHRDVKPDNILVESATGRALVADFGIAVVSGEMNADGICGTPEFMSPEQALGEELDARSDIYSLGATMFYSLSGRLTFEGRDATEVIGRLVKESAPSIMTAAASVPRKLAHLVDRCLSKDPAERPESAQQVADQLGLAIEQRKELPAALRAFAKRNGRMDGGGTLLALVGGLFASTAVSALAGAAAGVSVMGAWFVATPGVFAIVAARRMLDLGFTHADIGPAFRAEINASHEERNVQVVSRRSIRALIEGMFAKTARVSSATSAVLVPLAFANVNTPKFEVIGAVALAGLGIAAATSIAFLTLVQLRRDVDVEFWNRFWTGRVGAFAFSMARKWRGSKPVARAMTHRATELSLGIAAEQLFESLPKASRDSLGDIPALLGRLQRDAHQLRERYNALNDALNHAGPDSAGHHESLREERDAVHERMRETVAALENVRLGLLRLHAGTLTLDGLTTHVALAADLSDEMDRLAAANVEVESVLRFPRDIALTPA